MVESILSVSLDWFETQPYEISKGTMAGLSKSEIDGYMAYLATLPKDSIVKDLSEITEAT